MNRIELAGSRYTLVALGDLPLEGLTLDYDPRRRPHLTREQADLLAREADERRAAGQRIEARPLYRYHGCTCSPRMLLLKLGHCDYLQYLGLNRWHRDWVDAAGAPLRADALGLDVVLECPDGLVLDERSPQVAEAAGLWHVKPSGHLHPPQSVREAVLDEALSELGLEPAELEELRCLGLTHTHDTDKRTLILRARTGVSLAEMQARTRSEDWESTRLLALSPDPEALAGRLAEGGLTPSGHAALLMEGHRRHGDAWFQAAWTREAGSR